MGEITISESAVQVTVAAFIAAFRRTAERQVGARQAKKASKLQPAAQ